MRLQKLPKEYVTHLGLSSDTVDFLINVGLPTKLEDLKDSIEISFYFDKGLMIKKEFNGKNYIIIGNDSGTQLAVSLDDNHVYSIDIDNIVPTQPICFVNSSVEKLVKSIGCFIEFKGKIENKEQPEAQLIESMREQIIKIDMKAIHPSTWWGQVIDDPIRE